MCMMSFEIHSLYPRGSKTRPFPSSLQASSFAVRCMACVCPSVVHHNGRRNTSATTKHRIFYKAENAGRKSITMNPRGTSGARLSARFAPIQDCPPHLTERLPGPPVGRYSGTSTKDRVRRAARPDWASSPRCRIFRSGSEKLSLRIF